MEGSSEPSVIVGGPRSIYDLPEEMMLKILSYIGPEDLCHTITKVCAGWNTLTKDATLWKPRSYRCDATSDISRIEQVLTLAPALHSLIIDQRNDAAHILKVLFDKQVCIRKLILKNCQLDEDGSGLLANVVVLYPDLEALSLEGCGLHPSTGYSFISRLKNLSELNLKGIQGLSGETIRLIADGCQHLKKCNLDVIYPFDEIDPFQFRDDGIPFRDDDALYVIKKLGKQLTTLMLYGPLTDAAYLYLNNCARLQKLSLPVCYGMTDRGLLEGIGSLQELTSLCLIGDGSLTAQALTTFLDRPCMTSMVSLNLAWCKSLDDEGLKRITKRCVQLQELVLCGCKNVTDAGISMVVTHCNQLCALDLCDLYHITGDGWLPLVTANLRHLRLLSLDNSFGIHDEHIKELTAALPMLIVISSSGDILGAVSDKLQEIFYELSYEDACDFIMQWPLDRQIMGL